MSTWSLVLQRFLLPRSANVPTVIWYSSLAPVAGMRLTFCALRCRRRRKRTRQDYGGQQGLCRQPAHGHQVLRPQRAVRDHVNPSIQTMRG